MNNYGGLVSPSSGGKLELTNRKNIYRDPWNEVCFYRKDDGTLLPLVSPTSGRKLTIKEDGTYWADGYQFILDDRGILPTFIPDDTLEPAHVEGDYMVGNETGRHFPIRNNGRVIVPFDPIDIDPNLPLDELKAYFEERKRRQYNETQASIDARIEEDERQQQEAVSEAIERIQREGELERSKLGNNVARIKTERFLRIVEDEIEHGHELTQDEYRKLVTIMQSGYLPENMPDSEIAYDSNYVFLRTMLEQVKAGYGLSQEDLAKLISIINEPREEEKNANVNIRN